MTIKDINSKKTPIFVMDKSLEKYKHMPLFQEKVDATNEMLRNVGLPKTKAKPSVRKRA